MNALVGLALLQKDDAGRYSPTDEASAFLVRGKPTFQGGFFLLIGETAVAVAKPAGDRPQCPIEPAHQRRGRGGPVFAPIC